MLLQQLFSVIWREELVPRQWREGLIVNHNTAPLYIGIVQVGQHRSHTFVKSTFPWQ